MNYRRLTNHLEHQNRGHIKQDGDEGTWWGKKEEGPYSERGVCAKGTTNTNVEDAR